MPKPLLLYWGGALICIVFCNCKNFLNAGNVSDEIKEAIAYNNAKEITVLVQAAEGTGSTVPSGNHKAKQGYDFEVSFTENPAYCFIKWIAVSKDNPKTEITEGISFENAVSTVTKVKITNDSTAIRIIPLCVQRPAVVGEPSPRYESNGVSRDRSITVEFSKALNPDAFIFNEEDLPEGATAIKDENETIWVYKIENQTYLKNIKITNADDYSIAEHFTKPVIDGKILIIAADRTKPIEFETGVLFKTIKVTLSPDITDTDGIKMNFEKSWKYQITEATDDKATVNLTSNAMEGSVYLAGQKDYSIGQKITLSFTETADYQFIKWNYDSAYIAIAEPDSAQTYAYVREKTEGTPTNITAVCASRLRLAENGYEPKTNGNETVSKNSSIQLTFNQPLPTDSEGLAQLANIGITIGGNPVKTSYNSPVISGNTVSFTANRANLLDITEGQTKTVTVTIPADFYYKLSDGTKVTWGGNGFAFDYRIDSTTTQKTSVVFEMENDSGTLSPGVGLHEYSEGQEVSISFVPAIGWEFRGWSIKKDNVDVDDSKITILDDTELKTKMIVYEALSDVKVRANAVLLPAVSSFAPSYESSGKDCDTPVVITFNKPMKTNTFSLYSESNHQGTIQIINPSNENEHYEENYNEPSWSSDGKTLTLKPRNTIREALVKNENDLRNIRIVFDISTITDEDDNKLKESDSAWVYRINHSMETIAPTATMKMYKRGFDIEEQTITDANNPAYPKKYSTQENNTFTELTNANFGDNGFADSSNFSLNHIGAKVYFDAQVTDEGSGYKLLTINEKQIKTVDGYDVTGATIYTKTIELVEDSFNNAIEIFDKQGNLNLHSYTLQTAMDGVIELNFVFEDYAGNTNTKSWYVIKDTTISITEALNPKKATYADKIPVNGKVTETFDYSACKDIYYKNKSDSTNYSTECSYYLWCGTAENNAVYKGNSKSISFEHNITDYCYVWITACDSLGNIKRIKRLIPKQFELGTIDPNLSNMFYLAGRNELEEKQKMLGAAETVNSSVTLYKNNNGYDESKLTNTIINGYYVSFPSNGKYKTYFTIGLKWGEDCCYWAPLYGPYYVDYPINITDSQEPAFPETFSFTPELPLEKNTGFVQMHTILPENFTKTENYDYGVYWNYNYNVRYERLDFKAKSWVSNMPVHLFAKNNNSGKIYISENSVNITLCGNGYDNIPPNCSTGREIYYCSWPNMINNIYIAEYENDLYKNSSGQYEMEYYLIKKNNTSMNFDSIGTEELSLFQNEKILCPYYVSSVSGSNILLNVVPFIESYYDFVLNARDNKGNNRIYQSVYSNITSPEFPEIKSCKKDQNDATKTCITSCIKTIKEYQNYGIASFCNLTNNNVWEVVPGSTTKSDNNYTTSITNCPSGFLMIRYKGIKNGTTNTFASTLYNFLCPEYETKTQQEKDQVCKIEAVIPGLSGGFVVYYDAPCFAHTMAFPTNMLGDFDAKLAEAKSINPTIEDETYIKAIWETKGREYGLQLLNSAWLESAATKTYVVPVNEIPAGYSYITIFYFADGTTAMSEVKQK